MCLTCLSAICLSRTNSVTLALLLFVARTTYFPSFLSVETESPSGQNPRQLSLSLSRAALAEWRIERGNLDISCSHVRTLALLNYIEQGHGLFIFGTWVHNKNIASSHSPSTNPHRSTVIYFRGLNNSPGRSQ